MNPCVRCDYDLTGRGIGDVCPECGGYVVGNPFRGAWRRKSMRSRIMRGAVAVAGSSALTAIGFALMLVYELDATTPARDMLKSAGKLAILWGVFSWIVPAALFAFGWRDGAAVRVLLATMVLGLATLGACLIGVGRWTFSNDLLDVLIGVVLPALAAAIAVSPIYLRRSAGLRVGWGWLFCAPAVAFLVVAAMKLAFGDLRSPYKEIVCTLLVVGFVGISIGFAWLIRSLAATARMPLLR
jgi:hypothetical protein